MKNSRRKNCSLIAIAAFLRAAGKSWDDIAAAVGRSADRIRKWPRWYAEDWCYYFHLAEYQFLSDLAIETRLILRKLARSESEEIQLAACALVLRSRFNETAKMAFHLPEKSADPDAELIRENREIAAYVRTVKDMSEDKLNQLVRDAYECLTQETQSRPESADGAASRESESTRSDQFTGLE